MPDKGIVLTVGELKEMLSRFGEELMIRFADHDGHEFLFARFDMESDDDLRLELQC